MHATTHVVKKHADVAWLTTKTFYHMEMFSWQEYCEFVTQEGHEIPQREFEICDNKLLKMNVEVSDQVTSVLIALKYFNRMHEPIKRILNRIMVIIGYKYSKNTF